MLPKIKMHPVKGIQFKSKLFSIFLIVPFFFNWVKAQSPCNPSAIFSASNISTTRCHNQSITFTNPNALPGQYRFRFYNSSNVLLAGPVTVAANGTTSQSFPSGGGYKAVLIHQDISCKDSIIIEFDVNSHPNVNAGPDDDTVCINDAAYLLSAQTGVSPTIGGIWIGSGITNATTGLFNPATAGVGFHTMTYRFQDPNGCDSSDTKTIVVNPLPTVFARDTAFCRSIDGTAVQMVNAGGTLLGSGRWDDNGSGLGISLFGSFIPDTPGQFQVLFIWKNDKTCEVEKLVNIYVTEPAPVHAGPDLATCLDSTDYLLSGFTPQGGRWTGPGMSNSADSSFNPRSAGIGVHALVYTIGSGLCQRQDTIRLTVNPLPNVNAGPDQDTVCINDAAYPLSAEAGVSPTIGGIWIGSGITNATTGLFNPATAGVGSHTITYRFQSGNGCDSSDTKTIVVNPLPTVFATDTSVCRSTSGQLVQMINAGGTMPGSGRWDDNGSGLSINPDGTFVPNTVGNFQVKFIWKNDKTCESEKLVIISVIAPEGLEIRLSDPSFATNQSWKRCQLDPNSVDSSYSFYFDNQSLGSAGTTYKFTWGDGTPNTTVFQNSLPDTLVHLYTSFGVKNGTLLATDPNGCSASFPFKVVNEKFPSASLSVPINQVSICDGTTVTLSNNSLNATSYTWLWGDGDSLNTTSKSPLAHLYRLSDSVACKITVATGRKLDVKLKAFNTCYIHDNTSPIFVRPLPRLNLEFDTLVCVDPLTNLATVPFDLFVCPNRMMTNNSTITTIIFNDPFATPPSNPDSIVFDPNIPLTNISHQFKPGVYQIVAKAKNNCGTSIKTKLLTVCATTNRLGESFVAPPVIYPNPLTGFELHIDREDASQIRVYDVMGKLYLPKFRIENEECILLLGDLPAGMYFLDFESRGQHMRMKISK